MRALAEQKLPEVDALIARAQAMRDRLATATGCNCQTLDVCALFDGEIAIESERPAAAAPGGRGLVATGGYLFGYQKPR